MIGHLISYFLRAFAGRNLAKGGLDFGLHLGGIKIPNCHDAHEVGAVPVLVKLDQAVVRKGFKVLNCSDGEAGGVAAIVILLGQGLGENPVVGTEAGAPFGDHHTALFLDFFRIKTHGCGPVFEDFEATVKLGGICCREPEHIHRFIEAGVGVQVGAKAHANAFKIIDEVAFGEVGCAVEAHVFHKVGQAHLVVGFLHGACIHCEAKLCQPFGLGILLHIVAHAVGQHTGSHSRIQRNDPAGGGGCHRLLVGHPVHGPCRSSSCYRAGIAARRLFGCFARTQHQQHHQGSCPLAPGGLHC